MIVGFEELTLQCKDEVSRNHIREAIRCYEGGSYRAAIITAYIAMCFDLIAKLEVLGASGDGKAQALLNDLGQLRTQVDGGNQQAIAGLLQFERTLLDNFRSEFEFFGANEYDDLSRLRDDRNRCAHPTFLKSSQPFMPSAELARLHLRNVLVLVLTQEPKQGKAALDEVRSIVISKYFPDLVQDAKLRLEAAGLAAAREALIRAVVDDIVFGLPDINHAYHNKVAPYVALDAIVEINRPLALPRTIIDVNKLLRRPEELAIEVGSFISIRMPDVAAGIDGPGRAIVANWLLRSDNQFIGSAVQRGLQIDWLRASATTRAATLTADQLGKITGALPEPILGRAASLYTSARSWTQANDLAKKFAIPLADRFSEQNLDFIFQQAASGAADLPGSGGFNQFMEALYRESSLGKDKLDELTNRHGLEFYRP